MILDPSSFPYFLLLFSLAMMAGTYLIYSYYLDRLLIINAVIIFLCGVRVASEYYLQTLETYADVLAYAPWHILPMNILLPLQWIMVIYYVLPLRGLRYANFLHALIAFGFIFPPFLLVIYYTSIDPSIFVYAPERIGGYWCYMVDKEFWFTSLYTVHNQICLLLLNLCLLVGIIRSPRNRIRQILLLLSYIIIPIVYFAVARGEGWIVPNIGLMFLGHALVISWYVSNYRLFRGNYGLITKSLYDSITDLAIATDVAGNITHRNPAADAFFGQNNRKLSQKLGRLRADFPNGSELKLNDKSGQERTLRYRSAPVRSGDKLLGHTSTFTDLTEIRAREEELRQLNGTKDRLFAIIGHDLRRPALAFRDVGSKINYLLRNNKKEGLEKLTQNLEHEALTLTNLLDNLLNWALQQRQMLPNKPVQVELRAMLDGFAEEYAALLSGKDIQLGNTIPAGVRLIADRNAIRTVFRNLLDNASKFTPHGGSIDITAFKQAGTLVVTVTNTGVYLTTEEIDLIQNRSGPAGQTSTAAGASTQGFGLYLVRELMALHGGSLKIFSRAETGVTIELNFPT